MKIKKFKFDNLEKQLKTAWVPKTITKLDNYKLKIAKFKGGYHWHKHKNWDELFIVLKGKIKIQTKPVNIILNKGEGMTIPKNVEHCPIAVMPSIVLMFENSKIKSKKLNSNKTL